MSSCWAWLLNLLEFCHPEQLRESIGRVFASKGEKIVEMNKRAFDIGLEAAKNR